MRTVFQMSLVLILAKFIRKLGTSEKALEKRMSTAHLPPYFRERIAHLWAERENITPIVEILQSEGQSCKGLHGLVGFPLNTCCTLAKINTCSDVLVANCYLHQ